MTRKKKVTKVNQDCIYRGLEVFRFKSKSNCNTSTKVSKITKQTRIGREDDLK